jgi:murein DD-endopeptidase MepM/ murein hydrolase activator NlpD
MAGDLTGKELDANLSKIIPKTRTTKTETKAIADNLERGAKGAERIKAAMGFVAGKGGGKGGGGGGGDSLPGAGDMQTASGGGGGTSTYNRNGIGISDFLNFGKSMAGGLSKFMPDIAPAMQSAASYYNASLMAGTGQTRSKLRGATFSGLAGGMTSANSDAQVANILTSSGMSANRASYGQTVSAVGNAAKYLNMDNAAAAKAVSGLTSGSMSSNLLKNFGIYTSDLGSGKEKTQGQIFEEMAQRMTAGRGNASAEETLDSIRRGNLGESIANSGLSGDQQELFKQFMVARSQGVMMDLSDSKAMSKLTKIQESAGNANPLNGMMKMQTNQTEASNVSQDSYISGIEMAASALQGLVKVSGELTSVLGAVNAFGRTFTGNQQVQALGDMAGASIDMISAGMSGMGDMFNPVNQMMGRVGVVLGGAGLVGTGILGGAGLAKSVTGDNGPSNESNSMGSNGFDLTSMFGSGVGPSDTAAGSASSAYSGSTAPPLSGSPDISTKYGGVSAYSGKVHNAIDYAVKTGTPVYAIADGTVIGVTTGQPTYSWNGDGAWPGDAKGSNTGGNMITIEHDKGYKSKYMHLSEVLVKKGDAVKKGDLIGKSGNTGASTGSHLHLAVEDKNKTPIDPTTLNTKLGGAGTVPAMDAKALGQAQSLYNAMSGLYSGNMETMKSSLSALMQLINPGGSNSNYTSSGNTPGGSASPGGSSGSSGGGGGGMMGGAPSGPPQVNINVAVNGNEDEAKKFATLVAEYLQSNTLTSNLGGY